MYRLYSLFVLLLAPIKTVHIFRWSNSYPRMLVHFGISFVEFYCFLKSTALCYSSPSCSLHTFVFCTAGIIIASFASPDTGKANKRLFTPSKKMQFLTKTVPCSNTSPPGTPHDAGNAIRFFPTEKAPRAQATGAMLTRPIATTPHIFLVRVDVSTTELHNSKVLVRWHLALTGLRGLQRCCDYKRSTKARSVGWNAVRESQGAKLWALSAPEIFEIPYLGPSPTTRLKRVHPDRFVGRPCKIARLHHS